jgi:hypothetical protein
MRHDFLYAEQVQPGAGADDIDDGVDGADLVEVNLVDWSAVRLRLGFGESNEDRERRIPDGRVERGVLEQRADGAPIPRWLIIAAFDADPSALDCTTASGFRRDADAFDAKVGDRRFNRAQWHAGIYQRAQHHVTACAGEWIENCNSRHG